jgi:hypothetical protein
LTLLTCQMDLNIQNKEAKESDISRKKERESIDKKERENINKKEISALTSIPQEEKKYQH